MFTAMVPIQTPISRDHNKKLVKIIQNLLAYEDSNIFRKPMPHKALAWQDYKDIIKKPIDLNYVRRQYNQGKYKFVQEVFDEIQLIWENVFNYGKKQHESFDLALKMQKYFDQLLSDFFPEYHEKINRIAYFKQFETLKLDKKGMALFFQQKSTKKEQKMDIQHKKEQQKPQIEKQQILAPKKKQSLNLKKSQTIRQTIEPNVILSQDVKKQSNKRGTQVQLKLNQARKQAEDGQNNVIKSESQEKKQQSGKLNLQIEHKRQTNDQIKLIKKQQRNVQNQIIFQHDSHQKNQKLNSILNSLQTQVKIQPQPPKIQLNEPIQNQQSQQNPIPPIFVTLNKTPSQNQITELTNMMNLLFEIQEFDSLSKIVRILTKYEKQTMIIDGEDVNFRMNEIHISTYNKIKKELQLKFYQLENSQKVKGLSSLMVKHKIKSLLVDMELSSHVNEMNRQENKKKLIEGEGLMNQQGQAMILLQQ